MDRNAAEREFVEHLERHRDLLVKVASAYCPNAAQREDLVQDILVQVWSSRKRFDGRVKFSTWMYRVALNVAITAYRRELRRPDAVAFDDGFAEAVPSADGETDAERELLRERIEQLDPLNRAVLVLYLDDRPHREIAEILGISESNVGTKIGRIKHRLRREMSLAGDA